MVTLLIHTMNSSAVILECQCDFCSSWFAAIKIMDKLQFLGRIAALSVCGLLLQTD